MGRCELGRISVFSPTKLCGVLVLDLYLPPPPPSPPPPPPRPHTPLCHTPSFTYNFVTHHLSHTIFVTPSLSHTIFVIPSFTHTHLCHAPSLSHTHTICHTNLCYTPSFTHHLSHTSLSHTTLSHTIFVTPYLSHTHTIFVIPSFSHIFVTHTHIFVTHHVCRTSLTHTHTHTIFHTHLSTFVLRGRRGASDTWLGLGWVWWRAWVPLVARDARDAAALLTWPLATSTFVSRGRRGTWRHRSSFCVAGKARMGLGWVRWRARAPWSPVAPRHFCVAGVALGDIHRRFTWQVWHLAL